MGSEYGEIAASSANALVGVWSIHDNGNVAPRWTIGGPNGILRQARGVAIDPEHKTVFVSDRCCFNEAFRIKMVIAGKGFGNKGGTSI